MARGDDERRDAESAIAQLPAGWNVPPAVDRAALDFERALVVRFGRIGDMLVVTPALRALQRARPHARIDLLTGDDGRATLAGNPHVHEIFTFRRRRIPAFVNTERARLLRTLRQRKYDVVFLFETAERYRRLARAIGAPRPLSFARDDEQPSPAFARRVPDRHEGLRFLDVLALAGIPDDGVHYDFAIGNDARERAARVLRDLGIPEQARLAGVHAGHFQRRRRNRPHPKAWPIERYAAVVRALGERDMVVVLTGSKSEQRLNRAILHTAASGDALGPGATPAVVDLAGRTGLSTLAAVMERCAVFIAPDTGPAHLAAAVRTPLVALFGPKAPHIMGPLGDDAHIVRLYPPPAATSDVEREYFHPRMWAIEVEDVLAAAERVMRRDVAHE